MDDVTLFPKQTKMCFFIILYCTYELDNSAYKTRFFFNIMLKQDKYKGIECM